MGAKDKIVKQLSAAYLTRDMPSGGLNTTTSAAVAAGANTFNVVSATGLAVGDVLRLGSGEDLELVHVSNIAALVVTADAPLAYAHAAGAPVVEQTVYDLGDVTSDGVQVTAAGNTTDVSVATRRIVFTEMIGYVSVAATLALPTMTLFNLIAALGIPVAKVTGAGTPASPFHLVTDGNEFNSDINQSLIIISVLEDGTFLREELWGVDADYTGLTFKLDRGNLNSVPVKFVASAGGVLTTVASTYVPVTTYRPGKGKVFDALAEVGLFAAATVGPLATTTTALAAAGAQALSLVSATNLVAGDWIQVGAGELVEFHQVDSVVSLVANLRTALLRAQAVGTAVVRQQQVPFAGIHSDGVDVNFNGNVDPVQIATRRFQAGLRPGLATMSFGFKVIDFVLSNFARALGIPQTAIVGNRLLLGGSAMGSAPQVDGVYVRGLHQDGGTFQVNFWGCSTDLGNIVHALSNTGIGSIPLMFKPASGVQFLSYL